MKHTIISQLFQAFFSLNYSNDYRKEEKNTGLKKLASAWRLLRFSFFTPGIKKALFRFLAFFAVFTRFVFWRI